MLPNAYEEQYDKHTCHIVQKYVKMCVYKKHIKLLTDSVNKVHIRGSMYSTKELAGRSFV
jgi:hypothetical protein